jgi:hypothetical protein
MYHPSDLGAIDGNDLEFLELKNYDTNTLNLSGLTFSGITFTFANGTLLGPGQFFVLARDAAAFATKYPGVAIHGVYTGQLDNAGEQLALAYPFGATVFSVTYDDRLPWPVTPDIADFSLVPRNPGASPAPDRGSSWRASTNPGGSPGADDSAPNIPAIVIDEILTHTDPPQLDSIELFNPTENTVNVGGWFLTDESDLPKRFRIPDGTMIPSGGRIVFEESDFNPTPGVGNSFAFDSTGDDVHLFSATTTGEFTGYSHGAEFGAVFNGVSFGRYLNSVGEEFYPIQISPSLGETNGGPRIGPVVISEIHYHPDANGDEFLELLNLTGNPVPLFDPAHPTNAWKFTGLGFTFPTNVTFGSNAMLLLVATNPADFRIKYSVPTNVLIFGPYDGQLQDSGENLQLQSPDNPNTNGFVPYVTIEAVRYNDRAPWPPAADGGGPSLQRLQPSAYGNEPLNWIAAAPTPGQVNLNGDSDGDGLPDAWEQIHGTLVNVPDAGDDPDGDGLTNWQEYLAGTHPNDSASTLRLDAHGTAGGLTLEFFAASNRTYSILFKLTLDAGVWNVLTNISAHPTNRNATVLILPAEAQNQFYRLVTPAQP